MSLDGTSVPVTQSVLLVWTWSVCIHIAVASSSCCWPMSGRHNWQDSVAVLWPLMSPFLGCLAWCGNLTWSAVSGVHHLLFCCCYCCLNCCGSRIITCDASIRKSTLTQTVDAPKIAISVGLPESPFSWKSHPKHCLAVELGQSSHMAMKHLCREGRVDVYLVYR